MTSEIDWVETWTQRLNQSLRDLEGNESTLHVESQKSLPYAYEVQRYSPSGVQTSHSSYRTDVNIFDEYKESSWTPRVVIEAKLGRVTTHDALTYSSKAATHKHVHPYLRYGVLLGNNARYGVPVRLFRHGAYFDFLFSWCLSEPDQSEWNEFVEILWNEVQTSRQIQTMLTTSRKGHKITFNTIH